MMKLTPVSQSDRFNRTTEKEKEEKEEEEGKEKEILAIFGRHGDTWQFPVLPRDSSTWRGTLEHIDMIEEAGFFGRMINNR